MDYILEKCDDLYKSLKVHTPLNIDELLTVRLLSQQQGNISNNVINDFLKVSYQETLNTGNGLLFLLMATHLHQFGGNKDSYFSYLIFTVDLLKAL